MFFHLRFWSNKSTIQYITDLSVVQMLTSKTITRRSARSWRWLTSRSPSSGPLSSAMTLLWRNWKKWSDRHFYLTTSGLWLSDWLVRAATLLLWTHNLSVLDLEGNCFDPVTDAYISEIVSVNPLTSMSTLHIGDANGEIGSIPLTVSTVQLLLSKCDCLNQLDITNWNVTRQQFEEMKRIVKKNNWDLVIFGRVGWSN